MGSGSSTPWCGRQEAGERARPGRRDRGSSMPCTCSGEREGGSGSPSTGPGSPGPARGTPGPCSCSGRSFTRTSSSRSREGATSPCHRQRPRRPAHRAASHAPPGRGVHRTDRGRRRCGRGHNPFGVRAARGVDPRSRRLRLHPDGPVELVGPGIPPRGVIRRSTPGGTPARAPGPGRAGHTGRHRREQGGGWAVASARRVEGVPVRQLDGNPQEALRAARRPPASGAVRGGGRARGGEAGAGAAAAADSPVRVASRRRMDRCPRRVPQAGVRRGRPGPAR